jgi:hypothetical protein
MKRETFIQISILVLLLIGLLITILVVNHRLKDCKPHDTIVVKTLVDSTEYQFNVIDDSAYVYNNQRYVGVIKLNGTLDSLIISDNQ